MSKFIEVKVGDDTVATIRIPNESPNHPWLDVAVGPTEVVELTGDGQLPAAGDEWDGTKFTGLSGSIPYPDYVYFAFVVNGVCKLVQPINIETGMGFIAAYRSGVTFEVYNVSEV